MSDYWETRAANRMYEDMKTAEEAAEDIRRLYRRASYYIQSQGKDIFEAFRRQTGLTESEARRYIMQAKSPADMQVIINFVKQIQDPARRQELLNWVKASATQSRLARLASLQEAINNLVPFLYMQELALHRQTYQKIIQDAYLHKIFDIQQYSGHGRYVTPMNAKRIDKLMRERWLGSNYSSRLWGNTNRLAKSLRDELMVSFLTGRPQLATWRAIDAEFHKGHQAARRLVRTESNYLANQAHAEAYKDSNVDKYIYVATLDMRTSKICRSLDGKVFLVKNAQPGKNYPPMHPWCRSTTIAWMPAALLAKLKRTARDPVTGRNYKIPANMTYDEWYEKYVDKSKLLAHAPGSTKSFRRSLEEIQKGKAGLDKRRTNILKRVPTSGEHVRLKKDSVSERDLAYLSAATGHEFSLFRSKREDILVRGDARSCDVYGELADEILGGGYEWVGHSHVDRGILAASDADRGTLRKLGQKQSKIIGIDGNITEFSDDLFD